MRLIDADEIVYESIDSSDTEEYFAKYGTGILVVRKEDIDEMTTVEPHWIPVTERLPKPRESVIISVNGKYGDWIGEGCYWETTENHVIWKGYRWNATYWDDEIIAWMPLPAPWKGE